MKKVFSGVFLLLLSFIAVNAQAQSPPQSTEQQVRVQAQPVTPGEVWSAIDSSQEAKPGKRVYYQVTDSDVSAETAQRFKDDLTFSRKRPAFVINDYRSHGLADLFVLCQPTDGCSRGLLPFLVVIKIRGDSGRSAGTYDEAQPGDLAN